MTHRRLPVLAGIAASALVLSACGSSGTAATNSTSAASSAATSATAATSASSSSAGSPAPGSGAAGDCAPGSLPTLTDGTLTIATSEPAFEPWMVDNDPTNGKGFESAVAYAVAEQLGYPADKVTWTRVGFDEAIAKPGGFDVDINQFTITDDRKKQVDFSSGYYTVAQTVITIDGSPISGATTLAALKDAKLGAMNGTTSLQAITATIDPSTAPQVFDDNSLAAQALQNGQVDGLVVDLPTAFYMTGAQLDNGKVIGQLKAESGDAEQLGLLLAKDSALTTCVTAAVDALRDDGTLDALETQWLAGTGTAPVLG